MSDKKSGSSDDTNDDFDLSDLPGPTGQYDQCDLDRDALRSLNLRMTALEGRVIRIEGAISRLLDWMRRVFKDEPKG